MVANFSFPFARIERYRRSFLFSTIKLWNDLPSTSEFRISSAFCTFENNLSNFFFNSLLRNYLLYVWDRTTSIHHTRLMLNLSALNHELFTINCALPSASNFCNAPNEDAKPFFFFIDQALLLCAKYHCPRCALVRW